jgi:hypothetical protein
MNSSCLQQEEQQKIQTKTSIAIEIPENAIARVGESYITQSDLDQTITKTLGVPANKINNTEKQKIIDSLIQSRVFADIQEKNLSKIGQEELESKVKIYRDKLLVQQYLQQRLSKEKVTYEVLYKYYEEHPYLFGAGYIYRYEKITSLRKIRQEEKFDLLTVLSSPEKQSDWETWVSEVKKKGYPITCFQRSFNNSSMFESKNTKITMKRLSVGESTGIGFEQGYLQIFRLLKKETSPPEIYFKVKHKVKNAYNRTRMHKEIQKAFEEVKAQADIEIF